MWAPRKELRDVADFESGMGQGSNGGIGRACEACDTDNSWNRRFCRACGTKIVSACSACDFGNAIADLFCGGCGGDLAAVSTLSQQAASSRSASSQSASPSPASTSAKPPPVPRALDPAARALARTLSKLNNNNVQAGGKPPSTPANSGDDADDFGQDQIDALFG